MRKGECSLELFRVEGRVFIIFVEVLNFEVFCKKEDGIIMILLVMILLFWLFFYFMVY